MEGDHGERRWWLHNSRMMGLASASGVGSLVGPFFKFFSAFLRRACCLSLLHRISNDFVPEADSAVASENRF